MKLSLLGAAVPVVALAALATVGIAQIVRFDLPKIVAFSDGVVYGTIKDRHVVRIDHPVDGPELYFTTLTIEGRSLVTDKPVTVDVSHMGGFVDATHGSFNSEAPSADDTRIGNKVVCFWKHTENMGGDFECNSIVGWHGGIYRTFERRGNVIVQGRGDGYGIAANVALEDLKTSIRGLKK